MRKIERERKRGGREKEGERDHNQSHEKTQFFDIVNVS